MPATIRLSENAVAVLRFEVKGWKARDPASRLSAYRELAAAGIMESVPDAEGGYRFTEEGMARREEILREEEERIERERFGPPDVSGLSETSRDLLRRIVEGRVEVNADNLAAFRELMAARVVVLGHSFAGGPESAYSWTYWGWKRRFELTGRTKASA
ncbi:MAG: hypothetical protein U0835_23695 [Isosphaeraceae bacterium]